jgi:hypothetical protein
MIHLAGRHLNLSLVAVVVELHNVGALLDALQLVEFFVENVASGPDVEKRRVRRQRPALCPATGVDASSFDSVRGGAGGVRRLGCLT